MCYSIVSSDKGGGKCVCPHSSVCLLARLLKNACMDLDEMLRVDRCRDMDELRTMSASVCSTRGQSATRRPASSSGSEMRNSAKLHSSKHDTMTSRVQISSLASHQPSVLSRQHGPGRTTSAMNVCADDFKLIGTNWHEVVHMPNALMTSKSTNHGGICLLYDVSLRVRTVSLPTFQTFEVISAYVHRTGFNAVVVVVYTGLALRP